MLFLVLSIEFVQELSEWFNEFVPTNLSNSYNVVREHSLGKGKVHWQLISLTCLDSNKHENLLIILT